jgi:hypothetical protein
MSTEDGTKFQSLLTGPGLLREDDPNPAPHLGMVVGSEVRVGATAGSGRLLRIRD